jgi:hypothetical protein
VSLQIAEYTEISEQVETIESSFEAAPGPVPAVRPISNQAFKQLRQVFPGKLFGVGEQFWVWLITAGIERCSGYLCLSIRVPFDERDLGDGIDF